MAGRNAYVHVPDACIGSRIDMFDTICFRLIFRGSVRASEQVGVNLHRRTPASRKQHHQNRAYPILIEITMKYVEAALG